MHVRTHERIDNGLCGRVTALAEGHSRVEMTALAQMGVDAKGLVHGGFVFGLADHAAMVAKPDHQLDGDDVFRFRQLLDRR